MRKIILAITLVLCMSRLAAGQQWDITGGAPASPVPGLVSPFPSAANTATDIRQWPHACIVRVPDRTGFFKGSGALAMDPITKRRMVITAYHVVREGDQSNITVEFPTTGEKIRAQIAFKSATYDIASLALESVPKAGAGTPGSVFPVIGDIITMAGFGGTPRKGFKVWAGRALEIDASNASVTVTGSPSQGDSGGPVHSANGDLIGVISATNSPTLGTVAYAACWPPSMIPSLFCRPRGNITPRPRPGPAPLPVPSPQICEVDYDKIVSMVLEQMKGNPDFKGEPGENGAPGGQGGKGDDAVVSEDQIIEIAAAVIQRTEIQQFDILDRLEKLEGKEPDLGTLTGLILERLPPITVNAVRGDGSVADTVDVPLGGVLNINHRPITN